MSSTSPVVRWIGILWVGLLSSLCLAAVRPNTTLTNDQLATRFLAQATFGPSPDALAELRALNYDYGAWITREAAKPASSAVNILVVARDAGQITTINTDLNRRARNQVMISGSDQLRQRVAYALSQIMVVSDVDSAVANGQEGPSSYYDMLARNALGSFSTLLMDVTRHPMMGRYLSHYRNRMANPVTGTRPDENYAREVMQLFTIGLYQLQPNGNYVTDSTGRPLETYTSTDVSEFARVFTGFTYEGPNNTGTGSGRTDFPNNPVNYVAPMRMWEGQHDKGPKQLLRYPGATKSSLPANQTGLQDVQDAITNLVEHPSTAPFISRQLIQRLVTSNPSEGYIARVSAVFINNGSGVRGDLLAVVRAILLDQEARSTAFIADPEHGRLREPFLRITHLLRAGRYTITAGILNFNFGGTVTPATIGHYPMSSPSVFNFYSPEYEPPGPVAKAGLVGPEFQILNSVFAVTLPNAINTLIQTGAGTFRLNLSDYEALAGNSQSLVDQLDLMFTHGTMSAESKAVIRRAVDGVTAAMVPSGSNLNQTRARLALYLTVNSPDYAILK